MYEKLRSFDVNKIVPIQLGAFDFYIPLTFVKIFAFAFGAH